MHVYSGYYRIKMPYASVGRVQFPSLLSLLVSSYTVDISLHHKTTTRFDTIGSRMEEAWDCVARCVQVRMEVLWDYGRKIPWCLSATCLTVASVIVPHLS